MLNPAVLQFGTGRFLQAHVDLFVSEALAAGQALGGILVVQTTDHPASSARTAALAQAAPYPVRLRGLAGGETVDHTVWCRSVVGALQAAHDWPRVREAFVGPVQVVVSNTADQGYRLDPADDAAVLHDPAHAPRSFPAKLLQLLHLRWQRVPRAPLSLLPCELVSRNGDTLRDTVLALARAWQLPAAFADWLGGHCVWANTLVDRIVSEPIEPVGAVAEPYALWAVERQPGLVLPCAHPAIVLTDDLQRHERLKLFLLNGGHSFLAERWLRERGPEGFTVAQAMNDAAWRAELEALWSDEMVPVFSALGQREEALAYLAALRERLLNPFLAHRLADIAQNHGQKKQRRLAPIVELAVQFGLPHARLRQALAGAPG